MGQLNSIYIIIIVIPVLILFVWLSKKNKKKHGLSGDNLNSNKRDEVWRTIKEYLKNNNLKGLEVISSYSIRRPTIKQLHKRLKDAAIFEAKEQAKIINPKTSKWTSRWKRNYVKPIIPQKYELEDYFANLYQETYQLSLPHRDHAGVQDDHTALYQKHHRHHLIHKHHKRKQFQKGLVTKIKPTKFNQPKSTNNLPLDRELYVLIFRTKNIRTQEINPPEAIEVEIISKNVDKKNTERKIIINKALDLDKEMAWIKPIKTVDDQNAEKENIRAQKLAEKAKIRLENWKLNQMWYQKISPKFILPYINKLTAPRNK